DVLALQLRHLLAPVHEATDDRTPDVGPAVPGRRRVVVVRGDRVGVAVPVVVGGQGGDAIAGVCGGCVPDEWAFPLAPAEVVPRAHLVDRLDGVFADVPAEHPVAGTGIPAEPVRVAHTHCIDLAERARGGDERV